MRIYLKNKQALAYFHEKATPDFWEKHWETYDLRESLLTCTTDGFFIPLVKKYLSTGDTVLEGGCGWGLVVHALEFHGYRAIGIDFADKTVQKVKEAVPELDVRVGDIRNLPIEDETLDGYVSGGVIEHFWDGYDQIFAEMRRTLKPGGYLFMSFPYMSPLRKFKAAIGSYPVKTYHQLENMKENFYQFALDWKQVLRDLEQFGFTLREAILSNGIKGFKDELTWFKPWLQPIFDGKKQQRIAPYLDKIFKPFASHCIILVMQKFKDSQTTEKGNYEF